MPTIYGTSNDDTIHGSLWDDSIYGMDGDDTLYGSVGHDDLFGGLGDDTLYGGIGDDLLMGGAGADNLQGGAGIDTASYSRSATGVTVSLYSKTGVGHGSGGDAQGDTLEGIENLTGSAYDDVLAGDDGDNVIVGGGGNDIFYAGSGDDTLEGGTGSDQFRGGAGGDAIHGGAGNDEIVYFGDEGVVIDLLTGHGYGGDAEGDTFDEIETVIGSPHDDVFIGNFADNVLAGLKGTDTLIGGDGADTFKFGYSKLIHASVVTIEEGLGAAADTIADFNALQGDKIDLSKIGWSSHFQQDMGTFAFIGGGAFSGQGWELRYQQIGADTWLQADTNGDGQANFEIRCNGIINFTANDFIL